MFDHFAFSWLKSVTPFTFCKGFSGASLIIGLHHSDELSTLPLVFAGMNNMDKMLPRGQNE